MLFIIIIYFIALGTQFPQISTNCYKKIKICRCAYYYYYYYYYRHSLIQWFVLGIYTTDTTKNKEITLVIIIYIIIIRCDILYCPWYSNPEGKKINAKLLLVLFFFALGSKDPED